MTSEVWDIVPTACAQLIPCSASRCITAPARGRVLQRCEHSGTLGSPASSLVVLYRTTHPDNAVHEISNYALGRLSVVVSMRIEKT